MSGSDLVATIEDVSELVTAANAGDRNAWNQLVERYLPLVYSVIRRFRLSDRDAEDVNQTVWLRLVEHLPDLREPRAVPGWIVTTTRNEALRVLRVHGRSTPVDLAAPDALPLRADLPDSDDALLADERQRALRDGLAELSPQHRELLLLLVADPPVPYEEISRRLGMPVGSIGPTRARCLKKLRETEAMRRYLA
ncbi:RNA polymerase sigma factor [Nakamurella leprariae]|uniref:RNA polymerase sigma factor n=1 Tax=Nakamurella leprariae TaxID=2803911 RepID=UPI002E2E58CD|nr:sigma-70 family RNA polymerase sigma factor [Nakamurella leprariae]